MRPDETIPGTNGQWVGREEIKENDGRDDFKYDIFDIRTFVNATMYPHPAQQLKKKMYLKIKRYMH
jgi:hypothetical protein